MSEHRDPVVAKALRDLDVPDHGPDFWAALDARLVAGDGPEHLPTPPTDDEETTVVDLDTTRSARRRTPALALAAAVAIVVALVAGVALLGDDGDDESQLDVAETTETSVPEDTSPEPEDATTTTPPPETTTTTMVAAGDELARHAEATALSWIEALFAGDVDAAYGLFDDATRAEIDRAEFEELSSGLFEGAAAFAADGITRDVTILDPPDASLAVVTFTGDVQREGMVETAAYPVVVTASGVHLTLDGPQLELDPEYARSSGTTLASPLELLLSDTALVWVWYDDGEPERLDAAPSTSLDVEAAAGPGTHLVHLVALEGGRITARAYTVVVP